MKQATAIITDQGGYVVLISIFLLTSFTLIVVLLMLRSFLVNLVSQPSSAQVHHSFRMISSYNLVTPRKCNWNHSKWCRNYRLLLRRWRRCRLRGQRSFWTKCIEDGWFSKDQDLSPSKRRKPCWGSLPAHLTSSLFSSSLPGIPTFFLTRCWRWTYSSRIHDCLPHSSSPPRPSSLWRGSIIFVSVPCLIP